MNTTLERRARTKIGFQLLKAFIANEELSTKNFHYLDELLAIVGDEFRQGLIAKKDIDELNDIFGNEFLENTLHGRGLLKPNGYAGDYLFLDRIYTRHTHQDPKYRVWDEYVQQHAAPNAVRNRKEYFKKLVFKRASIHSYVKVLNLVSGSGRELKELYDILPNKNVGTTCIEIDRSAIDYSRQLNRNHLDQIEYVHANIFRYKNTNTYDVIWSAGLFDYLGEKAFVVLLRKLKNWLNPNGEIIIGNYNEAYNPSRDYLEILGDWQLIHRTRDQLIHLAQKAGFADFQINVERLTDNVILYLRLKKNIE